jgi:hypothetical protein
MRPSSRSDFVRVRPHHRYVSDPTLDLPLDPALPDDLLVDLPLTREELEGMVPMYQWELVAAAQRQVPISGGDALVIVQQIGSEVLEGQHPWFHDHHDALTWLRVETVARSMHFNYLRGRGRPSHPERWVDADAALRLAAGGDRFAIRRLFLFYTHTGLLEIEREVLDGCPRWLEGSTLTELDRALRRRRLPPPPVDLEPEKWLVDVVIDLAERRCARLRARAEREDVKEAA